MKPDGAFIRDLNNSRRAVNDFADRMRVRGFQCWLPPERTRPDVADRAEYADSGDMMIQGRIEHKVRSNIDFTTRDDYPYGTVIVDEAYKVDQKASDPFLAYVIENRSRTHAAVVYGWTRAHWTVESHYDPVQGRQCEFYVCPKRKVRFCQVGEVF